jgi:hypothetical protein
VPGGVRVNAVAPAFTLTDMTAGVGRSAQDLAPFVNRIALGRPGHPEQVAPAVQFLASPDAAYITGAVLTVDGAPAPRPASPTSCDGKSWRRATGTTRVRSGPAEAPPNHGLFVTYARPPSAQARCEVRMRVPGAVRARRVRVTVSADFAPVPGSGVTADPWHQGSDAGLTRTDGPPLSAVGTDPGMSPGI